MSELVTAVVTTYRRPTLARRAIESVLAQTYEPLELIVVEDGSDSGVGAWLEELDFPNTRYFRQEENRGLASARNIGWQEAQGNWVAFLDDDDMWKPRRVEAQMKLLGALEEKDGATIGIVYCGIEVRDQDGNIVRTIEPQTRGDLRQAIIERGSPHTLSSTFLFLRRALQEAGGFDENLPSSTDHDICMSLAECGYGVEAVEEALVVVLEQVGRETMVQDTEARIRGVQMFAEKWSPTYQEWIGPEEGRRWTERYHTVVIGRLAGDKLLTGHFAEALRAASEVIMYSDHGIRAGARLLVAIAGKLAGCLLPAGAYRRILKVLGRR